jgi:murein L,D-transpeptidase YafK
MGFSFKRKSLALVAAALAMGCLSQPNAVATAPQHQGDGEPAAADQQLPVPAAGLATDRDRRLAEKGMSAGSPIMIRIFKNESQLELWMLTGERYELFSTYRICNWSGTLGPKLHEGDKQAPEGFYSVGLAQIHRKGRWPRSLNIGYRMYVDRLLRHDQ